MSVIPRWPFRGAGSRIERAIRFTFIVYPSEASMNMIRPARRIVIPHPDKGFVDVTAQMPPHMRQSWNLIGFDDASAED